MNRVQSLILSAAIAAIGGSCAHRMGNSSVDGRFEQVAHEFLDSHFTARPLEGVALGWHQFDGQFVVPTRAMLADETARLKRFDRAFATLAVDQLSSDQRQDLAILRSAIASQLWILEVQRPAFLNPMFYAGALDVSVYLKRDFKPLNQRVQDITKVLERAGEVFAAGRQNLDPVLPQPFIETAIDVAEGSARFIEKDVAKAADAVQDQAVRTGFAAGSQSAVREIRAFIEWLKKERLPNACQGFAVGRDGYQAMLRTERVDLTPEQILEIGMSELQAEQSRFAAAAAAIDPARKPVEVYQSIQRDHPTAATLIADTEKNLEKIRQFVLERHIATLPSNVRARVQETLPPFRATSFASMDTPGPFETKATEAYYYVTPVEPEWPPQQAEEWLTAFNYYTTDIVSIHEAYPGHYLQFLALNASGASVAKKTFYSYPFVEGWAHYSEQMMVEEGFGLPANPVTASRAALANAAKYHLAQSDEALLRVCRLCCSVKLHTQGMTVQEATRFFMENCHYEEKPARQEALRGTYDPGYLYYTLGKLMWLKLRRDWQAQEGPKFTLQRFHDEVLRHGAPPIPLLREWLLRDPAKWKEPL